MTTGLKLIDTRRHECWFACLMHLC